MEEFHLGGRAATLEILRELALPPGARVLDIGSGIGGPARTLAREGRLHVTGIDLTPAYVALANELSACCGVAGHTTFMLGSALDLPFEASRFDGAMLIHAGMNIVDKGTLFAEVARVLRPGGRLVVYDVMRTTAQGEPAYPQPWAPTADVSALSAVDRYLAAITAAGMVPREPVDCTPLVRAAIAEARSAPPRIGLAQLMGSGFPEMFGNLTRALDAGVVAPVRIVADAP